MHQPLQMETTCGSLLSELQVISDYLCGFSISLCSIVNPKKFAEANMKSSYVKDLFCGIRKYGVKLESLTAKGTKCFLNLNKSVWRHIEGKWIRQSIVELR